MDLVVEKIVQELGLDCLQTWRLIEILEEVEK